MFPCVACKRLAKNPGLQHHRSDNVTVHLSARPKSEVWVVVTSLRSKVLFSNARLGHGGEAFVGPFTPMHWKEPRSFTVSAVVNQHAEWSKSQAHLNIR